MGFIDFLVGRSVQEVRYCGQFLRVVFDLGDRAEPALYTDLAELFTYASPTGEVIEGIPGQPNTLGHVLAIVGTDVTQADATEGGALTSCSRTEAESTAKPILCTKHGKSSAATPSTWLSLSRRRACGLGQQEPVRNPAAQRPLRRVAAGRDRQSLNLVRDVPLLASRGDGAESGPSRLRPRVRFRVLRALPRRRADLDAGPKRRAQQPVAHCTLERSLPDVWPMIVGQFPL